MIKVYLDWNVMTAMKNGGFAELKDIVVGNEKILLLYSTAHIGDLISGYDGSLELQTLIDSDLEFITILTQNLCLYNTGKAILVDYWDPKELFQQRIDLRRLSEGLSLKGFEKALTENEPFPGAGKMTLDSLIPATLKADLKAHLSNPDVAKHIEKIFPGILENPTVEGIFESFGKFIKNMNQKEGYKELRNTLQPGLGLERDKMINHQDPFKIIDEKRKLMPSPSISRNKVETAPEWYNEIVREYIVLDMDGYHEDKVTISKGRKQTFKNTTEDSFHTAFATCCNFFVTNDKKTISKCWYI